MGLLILAGVYKSKDESTASLWDAETGRAIFRATMSLETFHIFSRVIRFDNRETKAGRRERDKLAAVRTVWDKWVEHLSLLYNPGPNITVDERYKGLTHNKVVKHKKKKKFEQIFLLMKN